MRLSKDVIQNTNEQLHNYFPDIWILIGDALSRITSNYQVYINLHDMIGLTYVHEESQKVTAPYRTHNNPFCNQIKSDPDFFTRCVAQKEKVIKHCLEQGQPFYGQCYKGYDEYEFPVMINKQLVCILCIGHLSMVKKNSAPFLKDVAQLMHLIESAYYDYQMILIQPKNVALSETSLRNKQLVTTTLEFINNNYALDITLNVLAQNAFVNSSYLSSLFKKSLGLGIVDYLNRIRIDYSKFYLRNGKNTITEISQQVGFNDPGYFSRVFKKLEGISPNQYRNLL